jgi:tetratricopeptide (TPR) repeat protein
MTSRCDENVLLGFVLNLLEDKDAAEVRQHLTECTSCVAYLVTFQGRTNDEPRPFGPNVAVQELLASPQDRWLDSYAVDRSRYATPEAVQALIQACETALDEDLARAEALSSILIGCADALPKSFASSTLQAIAWTRRGTALLRRGRLDEATAAIATANERADRIPAADYERALIAFTAADILRERGNTAEALIVIREAAAVFLRYNDTRRHASAREMEAAVLFRSGEYKAAGDLFSHLLAAKPSDVVVRGRLAANAAHCFVRIGEHERALLLFEAAERIFAERGCEAHVVRIAWGKARTMRHLGDDDAAIAALRDVLDAFDRLHATAEWVRVGVELVEWLLPTGAFHDARTMASAVYDRAVHAGMPMQAVEAVSYLREAAIAETLTADRAEYVRSFLETLPSAPHAEFARPSNLG